MRQSKLNLRCGDVVQVRSQEEIMATLDDRGCFEHLPFMPEMMRYCGQQFRVYKRADKTCDTITGSGGRRMMDAVHLDELRCDGSEHGGCQAGCLIFWKEAWLRRIDTSANKTIVPRIDTSSCMSGIGKQVLNTNQSAFADHLSTSIYQAGSEAHDASPKFSCQATELLTATSPLSPWDARQYLRDVWSRNASVSQLLKVLLLAVTHRIIGIGISYRVLIACYNLLSTLFNGTPYPFRAGEIPNSSRTPTIQTDLQPGELVRVRPFAKILKTLNSDNKNRGLRFDAEMVPYCGNVYRVERRVYNIINEYTGEMMRFHNSCIVLTGVYCRAQYSQGRLMCPRSIPIYWREIWLERVT